MPIGVHDLEIPDASHAIGAAYLDHAARAKSWFFIGHSMNGHGVANRYLHTGMVSAGCVTVTSLDGWDHLYNYLIVSRKGDGLSVGTITVTR